jgi:hypothetical protein
MAASPIKHHALKRCFFEQKPEKTSGSSGSSRDPSAPVYTATYLWTWDHYQPVLTTNFNGPEAYGEKS